MQTLQYEDEITPEWAASWKRNLDSLVKLVQDRVKDKNLPLDFRWAIYIKFQKILPEATYYMDFDSLPEEISWFDDFYVERYQTVDLDEEFIEEVKEKNGNESWNVDIDSLKEEILQSGCGSFEMDW